MSRLGDLGLLAIRLSVGGAAMAHGTQKLFGWFGGGGIPGTTRTMREMGFQPPGASATLAGLGEAGGGALLALGLATGVGGSAVAGTMAAAGSVHAHRGSGFFNSNGGYELPATLGAVGAGLAASGPGRLSLDHATGDVLNRPWMRVAALGLAAVSAFVVVRRRHSVVEDRMVADLGR